jgi:hypothetical protein
MHWILVTYSERKRNLRREKVDNSTDLCFVAAASQSKTA